ncbi:hypothetical protein F4810DRAFT_719963 [Camillea tinctor]|nr:hypothetical protein F4810DRAFT_719963 [Camillea tinctor]
MATFEDMPLELRLDILQILDDHVDVYNAVEAGFILLDAFRQFQKTILTQVARNGIEREAMNEAVAAALCPRSTNMPWDWEGMRSKQRQRYQLEVKKHVDRYVEGDLDFPVELQGLMALNRLSHVVNKLVTRFAKVSWEHNISHLPRIDRPDFENEQPPPLTRRERAILQRALFRYELFARSVGLAGGQYPHLPLQQEDELFECFEGHEMQQILTVYNWILEDYREMINQFEANFVQEVKQAAQARKNRAWKGLALTCSLGPSIPSLPTAWLAGTPSRAIHTGGADTITTNALPYFSPASLRQGPAATGPNSERHTNEAFAASLQSFGLTLYARLCDASPAQRHRIITTSYTDVVRADRRWFAEPYSRYCAGDLDPIAQLRNAYNDLVRRSLDELTETGPSPRPANGTDASFHAPDGPTLERARARARDALRDELGLPNAALPEYLQMVARHPFDVRDEAACYLRNTGWWMWGDARLAKMGFRRHGLFAAYDRDARAVARRPPGAAPGTVEQRQRRDTMNVSLALWALRQYVGYLRGMEQRVVQDELSRLRLVVDEQDWEDIVKRYKVREREEGEEDMLRGMMGLNI